MQLTKFFLESTTDTGDDIVLDFMGIATYKPVVKDEKDVIFVTMTNGHCFHITASMTEMKHFAGKVGVPIYSVASVTK
jgi:hypothetical protein